MELLNRVNAIQNLAWSMHNKWDADLLILYAFAKWQMGTDRYAEYVAASIFASALLYPPAMDEARPILEPLARYYLSAYLANPLSDELIVKYLSAKSGEDGKQVFVDGLPGCEVPSCPLQRGLTLAELRAASMTEMNIPVSDLEDPLWIYASVGMEAMTAYRKILSGYAELLRLGCALPSVPDAQKAAIEASIKNVGTNVAKIWDDYVDDLSKIEFADNSARLNNFKGLWPIYTRARWAALTSLSCVALPANPSDELRIDQRWLKEVVRPTVQDNLYKTIAAATQIDYGRVDKELTNLEKSHTDLLW